MTQRKYLLDVSRQIHKIWARNLPTGIDRVCSAYLNNFQHHAQAVIHYKGLLRVLTPSHSDELFGLLLNAGEDFHSRLAKLAPRALAASKAEVEQPNTLYLNVAQTDFDQPVLSRWVNRNRLRAVYLIHDLIPITHSEFCRPVAVRKHHSRVVTALTHAAGIIVNSLATARDLERFAAEQGRAVPLYKAVWISGAEFERSHAAPSDRRPYFVVLGTIEGRKNHFMLLQIWRRLIESMGASAPRLVIIGQQGTEASHVLGMLERCETLRDHVEVLSHCKDSELARWVTQSRALLMPSFAEGFGLPVVEALQSGTPVIASDLACFREIGRGVPTLLDPLDAVAWQRMIVSFLQNGPERQRQMHALKTFRSPTWAEHFSHVEAWLEMLPPHAPALRLPKPIGRRYHKPAVGSVAAAVRRNPHSVEV